MSSDVYTAHLGLLNKDADNSSKETYAICPIMQSEIDALDVSSTVSVIRDTRNRSISKI